MHIVTYTAKASWDKPNLPKYHGKGKYLLTWEKSICEANVAEWDFVAVKNGEPLTCYYSYVKKEIQAIAHERYILEDFFETLGYKDLPESHRAEIGVLGEKKEEE